MISFIFFRGAAGQALAAVLAAETALVLALETAQVLAAETAQELARQAELAAEVQLVLELAEPEAELVLRQVGLVSEAELKQVPKK